MGSTPTATSFGESMKLLGTYTIGTRTVRVYTDKKSGNGSFNLGDNRLVVGINAKDWWEVVNVLLHEATEMVMLDNRCRFAPSVDFGNSADCYTFIMTHPQFSEITGQVANFLVQILPDLAKRYNKKC